MSTDFGLELYGAKGTVVLSSRYKSYRLLSVVTVSSTNSGAVRVQSIVPPMVFLRPSRFESAAAYGGISGNTLTPHLIFPVGGGEWECSAFYGTLYIFGVPPVSSPSGYGIQISDGSSSFTIGGDDYPLVVRDAFTLSRGVDSVGSDSVTVGYPSAAMAGYAGGAPYSGELFIFGSMYGSVRANYSNGYYVIFDYYRAAFVTTGNSDTYRDVTTNCISSNPINNAVSIMTIDTSKYPSAFP